MSGPYPCVSPPPRAGTRARTAALTHAHARARAHTRTKSNPANRSSTETEVTTYTVTTTIVVLVDCLAVPWYISRRHFSPVKQRPVILSLIHRLMTVGVLLVGLARIYSETFPCWLYLGAWCFAVLFGATGDVAKALYVYFEYCACEDLLAHFSPDRKAATPATAQAALLPGGGISGDEMAVYDTLSFAIRARVFIRTKLVRVTLAWSLFMITLYIVIVFAGTPAYATSTLAENQCFLAPYNIPAPVVCAVALLTFSMHTLMQGRMRRVQDNFDLKNDFNDLMKPTSVVTLLGVVSVIPAVVWYAFEHFMFFDLMLQLLSLSATWFIVLKPVVASYSGRYRVLNVEEFQSMRKLGFSADMDRFEQVLGSADATIAFEQFLIRELNVENLLFCRAVESFKQRATRAAQDRIVANFISDSGISQVNLPGALYNEVLAAHKSADVTPTIFDNAYEEIRTLLFRDAFLRFAKTPEFAAIGGTFASSPVATVVPFTA